MKAIIIFLAVTLSASLAAGFEPDSVWVRHDWDESGRGVAVAGRDQLYIVSLHGDGSTLLYYTIVKRLTMDGELVWSESLVTKRYGTVQALSVTPTQDGKIVVGTSTREGDPVTSRHYLFARDSTGALVWDHHWDTPLNLHRVDVAADLKGSVFMVALTSTDSTLADWHLVKVSPEGRILWERFYDGPTHGTDLVCALAADDLGGVYVAGTSVDTLNVAKPVLLKYDSSGQLAWVRTLKPENSLFATFTEVCVTPSGDVCAVGFDNTSTRSPGPVLRVSPEGDSLWCRWLEGRPQCATLDLHGNLCVAGSAPLCLDIRTWKLSPTGVLLWESTFDGPAGLMDCANAIASDLHGKVYVCGYSVERYDPQTELMDVLAYSDEGELLWTEQYVVNGHTLAYARSIDTDLEGCVYVNGASYQRVHLGGACVTLKYPATPSGTAEERPESARAVPGPTVLCGPELLTRGFRILDIQGRDVTAWSELAPGIYFVRSAESGGRSAVSRIVILR